MGSFTSTRVNRAVICRRAAGNLGAGRVICGQIYRCRRRTVNFDSRPHIAVITILSVDTPPRQKHFSNWSAGIRQLASLGTWDAAHGVSTRFAKQLVEYQRSIGRPRWDCAGTGTHRLLLMGARHSVKMCPRDESPQNCGPMGPDHATFVAIEGRLGGDCASSGRDAVGRRHVGAPSDGNCRPPGSVASRVAHPGLGGAGRAAGSGTSGGRPPLSSKLSRTGVGRRRGLDQHGRPHRPEAIAWQVRRARLLDLLLHQLHARAARVEEVGTCLPQRNRRDRRTLGQVRNRAGFEEH